MSQNPTISNDDAFTRVATARENTDIIIAVLDELLEYSHQVSLGDAIQALQTVRDEMESNVLNQLAPITHQRSISAMLNHISSYKHSIHS